MRVAAGETVLQPDEALLGFFSRVAASHDLPLVAFCRIKGATLLRLSRNLPDAIGKLACQWSMDAAFLSVRGVHREGPRDFWVGDRRNLYASLPRTGLRYCPCCVMADYRCQSGPAAARPYQRNSWLSPYVQVCTDHGVRLLAVPAELALSNQYDFSACVSQRRAAIEREAWDAPRVGIHASQCFFRRRMDDPQATGEYLDAFTTKTAARLCVAFGTLLGNPRRGDVEGAIARGYDAIRGGPAMIRESLDRHCRTVDRRSTRKAVYGPVCTLIDKSDAGQFGPMLDFIRQDGVSRLPLGVGDDFYGEVTERQIHSVRSASQAYGVHPRHVRYLFARFGVLGEGDDKRRDHDVLVHVAVAEKILSGRGEEDLITHREAMRTLQADYRIMEFLTASGHLETVGRSGRVEYRREQFERLRDRFRNLPPASSRDEKVVSLRRAASRTAGTIINLLGLILEGELRGMRTCPEPTLRSIRVPVAALPAILAEVRAAEIDDGTVCFRRATRELGVSDATLHALLAGGHLTYTRRREGTVSNRYIGIAKSDIEAFSRRYVSLTEVQQRTGIAMRHIKPFLRGRGVPVAIGSPDSKIGTYYDRKAADDAIAANDRDG